MCIVHVQSSFLKLKTNIQLGTTYVQYVRKGGSFLGIPVFHKEATVQWASTYNTKVLLVKLELCFDLRKHKKV